MGDELTRIEFLEPPEDPAEIAWLDADGEEREHLGGSRGSSLLPPRTTARRVFASLLIFALALSTTGFAGVDAFRHDRAVQAAANELLLGGVQVGDPVTLTDPGELGGLGTWRMEPSVSISVGVTNESPDPITLLPGATLLGPGVTAPATLRVSGTASLRPGQSTELTGVVTVDCGVLKQRPSTATESNTVQVRARTASGAVGDATVTLPGGAESVRLQICAEQGAGLAASFFPESVNTAKRSFTVGISAHSLAARDLRYRAAVAYSSSVTSIGGPAPEAAGLPTGDGEPILPGWTTSSDLPGVTLSAPVPVGAVDGTLATGGDMSAGFTIQVLTCPSSVPTMPSAVELTVLLDDDGVPAIFQADGFDLDTLVGAACGLIA